MLPFTVRQDEGFGLDSISEAVGLDIGKKALELVSHPSPPGHSKRLIAKPIQLLETELDD